MRSPDQRKYPLFQHETPEPDYSQFKSKPLRPGPKLYPYDPDKEGMWTGQFQDLVEEGVVTVKRKIGSKKPRFQRGQFVEAQDAVWNGDRELAIITEIYPDETLITLQKVEETHEEIRPLTEDETGRFERHEDVTLPAGGVWLQEARTYTEGVPVPNYLGDNFRDFFFTIKDSSGLIRIAKGKRSGTDIVFSRAD